MTTTETTAAVYVGTYRKYNEGSIFGGWLKLSDYANAEEFYDACKELHKDETDPEFMFQDYEGFPQSLYSESGNIDEIYEYLDFINDNSIDKDAFAAYMELGHDLEEAMKNFEEAYEGQWGSDREFCEQLFDEVNDIPDHLVGYIDYKQVTYDYMMDFQEQDGYYFRTF